MKLKTWHFYIIVDKALKPDDWLAAASVMETNLNYRHVDMWLFATSTPNDLAWLRSQATLSGFEGMAADARHRGRSEIEAALASSLDGTDLMIQTVAID